MSALHTSRESDEQSPAGDDPLAWWRDARFGMFIHWGIYAVPAGVYRGQEVHGIGEWIRAKANIPFDEYAAYAQRFTAERFDAERWARLARDAGMKYLVITAKHHDGFAMFESKASRFNIVDATPFRRDPMKDLAEACHRHGIRLCFYYSQALDWEDPNGAIAPPLGTMQGRDFARYLGTKVKPQLRELLTNYGPVGLIWCDVPMHITPEQSREVVRFVKSIQPECLVSGRVGHGVGDYESLGDNQIPAGHVLGDWETPATINHTWGYKRDDHDWKPTELLLRQLVSLAGKGVNYLLNVGPDARGEIPPPSVERLEAIGGWMGVNGDAIHGTRANPFPYDFEWGHITRKPGRLFLHFIRWPRERFTLLGLRNRVRGVRLLADRDAAVPFEQQRDASSGIDVLHIDLPAHPPDPAVSVVELVIDGEADAEQAIIQQIDRTITLPAHLARLHVDVSSGDRPRDDGQVHADVAVAAEHFAANDRMRIDASGLIEQWRRTGDWVDWAFRLTTPGRFIVEIQTVAAKYEPWRGGHAVRVTVGEETLRSRIDRGQAVSGERQEYFAEVATVLGEVRLDRPGEWRLALHAEHIAADVSTGLQVSLLRLRPLEEPSSTSETPRGAP